MPQLDLAEKRAKSISVIAIVASYKINFIGFQLYRNESELIRIPGFVPCNFCRVLLHISPPARIAGADRIRGSVVGVRKEEKLR